MQLDQLKKIKRTKSGLRMMWSKFDKKYLKYFQKVKTFYTLKMDNKVILLTKE